MMMPTWQKILYAVIVFGLIFMLFRALKSNPQWLSKENITKSFGTMGILALVLIGFVGLLVLLLRSR